VTIGEVLALLALSSAGTATSLLSQSRIPPVRVAVTAGRAEHIVALGGSPESATGTTLGIALAVAPAPWLDIYARSGSGTLSASDTRESHDLADAEVGVSALVLPWLAAVASAEGLSYSGAFASQRWILFRTGAEARLDLANGAVRGIVRGSFLPKVSVTGLESPSLAVGGATGIEVRRNRLFASLLYSIDRFDFPAGASEKRSEQLSSLMLQAGWRFGRQPAVVPGQ
jgi:hypothetical protein